MIEKVINGNLVKVAIDEKSIPASNENLLLNPWFTVNQRGVTSGTTTNNTPMLDCWKTSYGNNTGTWTLTSDGLALVAASATDQCLVYQILENVADLNGKVLTFSAKMSNGDIFSFTFTRVNGTTQQAFLNSDHLNLRFSTDDRVNIIYKHGVAQTVRAVKLELGNRSTLHLDKAPDYTTELLKCQRYFHIYKTSSLRPTYKEDCVPVMRTNPTQSTITISGTTYYTNSAEL